jgi:hypothetical protein
MVTVLQVLVSLHIIPQNPKTPTHL